MILDAARVAELQYFLMDAAKRRVVASGEPPARTEELLASAAALDYVLLMAVRHAADIADDDGTVATSVRETMTRAAQAALDVVALMLRAPDASFDDFVERHVRTTCVFANLRDLLQRRIVRSDDVAFRCLTLASEILERRARSR